MLVWKIYNFRTLFFNICVFEINCNINNCDKYGVFHKKMFNIIVNDAKSLIYYVQPTEKIIS